jgi:hypothetical protein
MQHLLKKVRWYKSRRPEQTIKEVSNENIQPSNLWRRIPYSDSAKEKISLGEIAKRWSEANPLSVVNCLGSYHHFCFDNGRDFCRHVDIARALAYGVYFAKSYQFLRLFIGQLLCRLQ